MVAREHPEPPKRAVVEEALRVYRAELVAEAAADATRARRRGTTRDGGAVAPLPVAPEALRGLAEALKRALPSPGGRHHYRLAAAAWLLAEGVPATVVAKVLPATSTEDARDAAKAVEDTVRRVASDKRVRSAGFLSRVLGEGGFQALSDALEADLAAAGVASRGFARTRRALDEAPVPEREVASDEVAGVLAELLAADVSLAWTAEAVAKIRHTGSPSSRKVKIPARRRTSSPVIVSRSALICFASVFVTTENEKARPSSSAAHRCVA